MEQKWFLFVEVTGDVEHLFAHRSWTGDGVFRAHASPSPPTADRSATPS